MKKYAIALSAIVLTALLLALYPSKANTEPLYVNHLVRHGDTLWSICKGYADYYGDRRSYEEIIYYARQQNNITNCGNMQPGDKLVIELLVERGEQLEKE